MHCIVSDDDAIDPADDASNTAPWYSVVLVYVIVASSMFDEPYTFVAPCMSTTSRRCVTADAHTNVDPVTVTNDPVSCAPSVRKNDSCAIGVAVTENVSVTDVSYRFTTGAVTLVVVSNSCDDSTVSCAVADVPVIDSSATGAPVAVQNTPLALIVIRVAPPCSSKLAAAFVHVIAAFVSVVGLSTDADPTAPPTNTLCPLVAIIVLSVTISENQGAAPAMCTFRVALSSCDGVDASVTPITLTASDAADCIAMLCDAPVLTIDCEMMRRKFVPVAVVSGPTKYQFEPVVAVTAELAVTSSSRRCSSHRHSRLGCSRRPSASMPRSLCPSP